MNTFRLHIYLLLLLFSAAATKAQTNEEKAKSAYLNAEKLFDADNYQEAANNLYKAKDYLGRTNPKLQYLLVKSLYYATSYDKAKQEISEYFRLVRGNETEQGEKYKDMLELVDQLDNTSRTQNKLVNKINNISGKYVNESGVVLNVEQNGNKYVMVLNFPLTGILTKGHTAYIQLTFEANFNFRDTYHIPRGGERIELLAKSNCKAILSQVDFNVIENFIPNQPVFSTYEVMYADSNTDEIARRIVIQIEHFNTFNLKNNGKIFLDPNGGDYIGNRRFEFTLQ